MISAYIVLTIMAVGLFIAAKRKGDGSHKNGISSGFRTLKSMLPLLIVAFILAGILPKAIPPTVIQKWLGMEAGWKGIVIGSLAGALIPGGPYVAFPIIGSIYEAGAALGTAVAFVTSWALCGITIVAFEIPFVGPKFTLMRYSLVLFLPFLAGLLAHILFA